ncbi:MAG: hypothetical protein ACR2P8_09715 [Myxococcota bacterium]
MRLLVIGLFALLLACGAQDSGDAGTTGEAPPPVSAETSRAAETAPVEVESPSPPATPQSVTSCLSLVKEGEYRRAVDVCVAALSDAPGNREVEAALTKAREETAKMAAAEATKAGSATDAAADAAGGIPNPPQGLTP